MQYTTAHGIRLPLFQLGTVQLGMNYGITGQAEKPSREYAFSMLDRALELGVDMLDTANNYGDSEAVIGEWLRTVDKARRPKIITKIGPLDHGSAAALRADIRRQTEKCLETLGVEKIDILMLHYFNDLAPDFDTVTDEMHRLKSLGLIEKSAISLYTHDDYRLVAKSGLDAVQIPLNIFDLGKINDGGIDALADAGMMIFTRSVFLQGLVFMSEESLDARMSFARPALAKLHGLCREFGMTPPVLAASFVRSVRGVTSLVLGCQRIPQIEENCKMLDETRTLRADEMKKIHEAFDGIDPRVIDPRLWYNK